MPVFPIYMDLKDKKCVIAGGGKVAARKIEVLINFCNNIVVVSPHITDRINDLKNKGMINYIKGMASEEILKDSFIIIAATDDKVANEKIYQYAFENNILINVVDDPGRCTFVFPSIVKRDDLVVGISTSGKFPALSKKIRRMIEAIIPENLGKKLELLSINRRAVIKKIDDPKLKKELINRILDLVIFEDDEDNEKELLNKIEKIIGEVKDEKIN